MLRGLTTALHLIQFENDRRRRAKEEVEPVPEGSAVVRIIPAAPRLLDPLDRRFVSRDMWAPEAEVSVQRDYQKRGGFRWSKYTTYARFGATQSAYGANPCRAREF